MGRKAVKSKMVYTTYFAKIKTLPKNIQPISIALWPPRGWVGVSYPKLAPTKSILLQYKQNPSQKIYAERYRKEVLDKLDPQEVVRELKELAGGQDVALVCFERSGQFCHRNLVRTWLAPWEPCAEW